MKQILFLLAAVLLLGGCAEEKKTDVRWATFNIRYDNPQDSLNNWQYRKDRVCQFIKDHELDIVGMQEVLHNQFQDLRAGLPEYDGIGVGRDDGKTAGEYAPLFYRKDKYEVLDSNTFWLAENPDSVGMMGWDAVCVRIATWAKFKDKATGKIFMAVNTHFDHVGEEARRQSALLIIRKIKEIVGERPAVVTGDFNVTDASDAYETITTNEFVMKDAYIHIVLKIGVKDCTRDGGAGVDVFLQYIRRFSGHNVSQETAAHSGDHTEKDNQKMVASVAGQHCGVDAYHGKGAKSYRIEDIHDFLIHFDGPAGKYLLVAPYDYKQDHNRYEGK